MVYIHLAVAGKVPTRTLLNFWMGVRVWLLRLKRVISILIKWGAFE
jgi:hypothetical protein